MTRLGIIARWLHGTVARLAGCALLGLAATALLFSVVNFPDWATRRLQAALSRGVFAYRIGAARLDILHGVKLSDVRVYRKRVVGEPGAEAREVIVTLQLLSWLLADQPVRSIRLRDGVVRPWQCFGPASASVSEWEAPPTHFALELERCEVYGIEAVSLDARVYADRYGMRVERINGLVRREDVDGLVSGDVLFDADTRTASGSLATQFDLHLILPVLDAWKMPFTSALVNRFTFRSPPRCEVNFRKSFNVEGDFGLRGAFAFEDGTYRGVDVRRADGRVAIDFTSTSGVVRVDSLTIVREEGAATGGFAIDLKEGVISFDGVSTLDPKALARMLQLFDEETMAAWRFEGPIRVAARGSADYSGRYEHVDFTGEVDGVRMGIDPWLADQCSFRFKMVGPTNTWTEVRGQLYSGRMEGAVEFVVPTGVETNVRYRIDGRVEDLDFQRLVHVIREEDSREYRGRLSGGGTVEGLLGAGMGRTAVGKGSLRVRDGRIYQLPVFGGLSDFMTRVVPGLDFVLRQSDMKGDFTIANGRIASDKILIEGDVLSLNGDGAYALDGTLDFEIQVKLMKEHTLVAKVVQFITYPLSKLFEFRLRGTLSRPEWYPENFSRDLLEKLGWDRREPPAAAAGK